MMTVHEVSKIAGVSIRTLHHYDQIGLLTPASITEAGYRLYDEASLERLQQILLFRQLKFSLKEIKEILNHPEFDKKEVLDAQIKLLEMQKEQLETLILFARKLREGEDVSMDFESFDTTRIEEYTKEAKERWGKTTVWQEYEEKSKGRTKKQEDALGEEFMEVFVEFGTMLSDDPASGPVQVQVKKLQDYISYHYYTCTDEILKGLGQMYVADERFRRNIDKKAGEGTAKFVSAAIAQYVK